MNKTIIISLILAVLMISSSLVVIDSGLNKGHSGSAALPYSTASQNYTLTFKENGLENLFPGSMNWTVIIRNSSAGALHYFTGTQGTVTLAAGSYVYYEAYNYFQDEIFPSYFTVNSNMTFNVNFTVPHKFTFIGTGLSSQNTWGVTMTPFTLSNMYTPNATAKGGSNVVYYGTDTSYSYDWYEVHNGTMTKLGSSYLSINSADQNFTYKLPLNSLSNVTVKEANLPSGTSWFLAPQNPGLSTQETSGSTINLTLQDGPSTYTYGYVLHNGQSINIGNVTLNAGSSNSYTLQFPTLTNVSFNDVQPYPAYTNGWGVQGQFSSSGMINSFNVSASFELDYVWLPDSAKVNVTPYIIYGFTTTYSGTGGYLVPWPSYTIDVSSSTAPQSVQFTSYTTTSVKVAGIPSGSYATITGNGAGLSGYSETVSSGQSFNILAPNGTYSFGMSLSTPIRESFSFNVTVGGNNPTSSIMLYGVTFPSPSSSLIGASVWGNGLSSIFDTTTSTQGTSLVGYLPNGSYGYYVTDINAGPSNIGIPESGAFNITGASVTINENFPTQFYNATVTAVGLAPSTQWNADFSAMTGNGFSAITVLTTKTSGSLWLPAGEYELGLNKASNTTQDFASNGTTINVTAAGPNVFDLNITPYSYITFHESGLLPGSSWSVTLNGNTYTSTGSSITATVNLGFKTGSYPFVIGNVKGYSSNPGSGSVNLSNTNGNTNFVVPVVFTSNGRFGDFTNINTFTLSDMKLHQGSYLSSDSTSNGGPIAFDKARGNVYIGYSKSDVAGILVLNSSTYAIVASIPLQTYGNVVSMVVDQATGYLYASYSYEYSGYIISINLNTFTTSITPTGYVQPVSLLVDPVTGALYAGTSYSVYVFNPYSLAVESVIPMPGTAYFNPFYYDQPIGLEYSNATGMIYATGYTSNSIVEINPGTNTISGQFAFSYPKNAYLLTGGSALDSKNGNIYLEMTMYVSPETFSSQLEVFNPASGTFLNPISLPYGTDFMIAVNPANGNLYAPIDTYVSPNYNYSSLSVGILAEINVSSNKVIDTFSTGLQTYQAAVNPLNGNVLVSNSASGAINIISSSSTFGYLSGTVSNKEANITVDGLPIQVVNGAFNVTLAPGTYYLTAYANGSAPVFKEVTVSAFATTSVSISMNQSTTYRVYGQVSPGTASVMLDGLGASVNSTGGYSIYVSAGKYTLSAYMAGYFPYSASLDVASNMEVNLSLQKEPTPTSMQTLGDVTGDGFNVTLSNLTAGSESISLNFTSPGNGILTIEVPYSVMKNVSVSDILNSSVYINGKPYSDFSVTISSNFTVILKVSGLKGDPQLVWAYGPAAVIPPPLKTPPGTSPLLWVAVGAIVVIAAIGGTSYYMRRKKS